MKLGWKTITGGILAGVGIAGKAVLPMVGHPEFAPVADLVTAGGVSLGGYGLRQAIAKVMEAIATTAAAGVSDGK